MFAVQLPDRRNFIVDGEFQILNRDFEPEMLNKESSVFKKLAFNITYEVSDNPSFDFPAP